MIFFILGLAMVVLLLAVLVMIRIIFLIPSALSAAPYAPLNLEKVVKVIDLAQIKPGQTLIDLGSGDGRILIAAARAGALGVGYEIDPFLVILSRWKVKKAGLGERIKITRKSLWKADVSKADIVTLHLVDFPMRRLEDKLKKELKLGTRIISAYFKFPNWEPVSVSPEKIYLYEKG